MCIYTFRCSLSVGLIFFFLTGPILKLTGAPVANLDSLVKVANEMEDSGEKGIAYMDIATEYLYIDPESTLFYSRKTRELGERMELDSLQGIGYAGEGVYYITEGFDKKAIDLFTTALGYFDSDRDLQRVMGIRINLATIFMRRGETEKAEEEFMSVEEMLEVNPWPNGARVVYNNLGEIYEHKEDFEKASQYFLLSESFCEPDDKRALALVKINLGYLNNRMKNHEVALEYLRNAQKRLEGTDFDLELMQVHEGLSLAHLGLGNLSEAKRNLDIAKTYFGESRAPTFVSSLRSTEIKYFEKAGQFEKANALLWTEKKYGDSIAAANKKSDLALFESELDLELKEKEISLLEKNNALEKEKRERSILYNYALGIGLALILLVLILFIVLLNQRGKVNRQLHLKNREIEIKNRLLEERRESLELANREKDGLIGIVAHDLQSPLNKGLALVEMVNQAGELNPAQEKALGMLKKSNHIGLLLIKDLLELNETEGEGAPLKKERVQLTAAISEITATFEPEGKRKGIELLSSIQPEPLQISIDPLTLNRILENLVSNALKFSGKGTTVEIKAQQIEGKIAIEVADQGPGISPEDQKSLFMKFKRLSAKPTGGEDSTGLGLAIVKTLVEKSGGEIKVVSKVGVGSRFIMKFPLEA